MTTVNTDQETKLKQASVFIRTMRVVAIHTADACTSGDLTPRETAAILTALADEMLVLSQAMREGRHIPSTNIAESDAVNRLAEIA